MKYCVRLTHNGNHVQFLVTDPVIPGEVPSKIVERADMIVQYPLPASVKVIKDRGGFFTPSLQVEERSLLLWLVMGARDKDLKALYTSARPVLR